MTDVILLPRDGMFLKDSRGWAPAGAGRAHSLDWPMPSTLLGALRTACGRAQEVDRRQGAAFTREDWARLATETKLEGTLPLRRPLHQDWSADHRVWPVPADCLYLPGELRRLDPVPPRTESLGRDDTPGAAVCGKMWAPRPDSKDKPSRAPAWWPEAVFMRWLTEAPDCQSRDGVADLAQPSHVRTHVSIERDTMAAKEGALFAHQVIETLEGSHGRNLAEWGILCRFVGERAAPKLPKLATLGGDRRVVRVEQANKALFNGPDSLWKAFDTHKPLGLRLVVVTPCAFGEGWLPDLFVPATDVFDGTLPGMDAMVALRAALITRPTHVSGWDMATNQPKIATRLVPRGAVFFFTKRDRTAFTGAEAKGLWLCALGDRTPEGFGRLVPGIWRPATPVSNTGSTA